MINEITSNVLIRRQLALVSAIKGRHRLFRGAFFTISYRFADNLRNDRLIYKMSARRRHHGSAK